MSGAFCARRLVCLMFCLTDIVTLCLSRKLKTNVHERKFYQTFQGFWFNTSSPVGTARNTCLPCLLGSVLSRTMLTKIPLHSKIKNEEKIMLVVWEPSLNFIFIFIST